VSYIDFLKAFIFGVQHGYCLSLLADHLKPGMSVLDVGSGSGYLTAVFGLMVCDLSSLVPPYQLWQHGMQKNS
jgi:protein-L-isoaspartate O-methyltransferase